MRKQIANYGLAWAERHKRVVDPRSSAGPQIGPGPNQAAWAGSPVIPGLS